MYRIVSDLKNKNIQIVQQKIYKDSNGVLVVLDADQQAPSDFQEITEEEFEVIQHIAV